MDIWLPTDFAMMKQTNQNAIMMVEIAVDCALWKINAHNVLVSSLMFMNTMLQIH